MNFYDLERYGRERVARLQRDAAIAAVMQASGPSGIARVTAGALRRLAAGIDHGRRLSEAAAHEIAQPVVALARQSA